VVQIAIGGFDERLGRIRGLVESCDTDTDRKLYALGPAHCADVLRFSHHAQALGQTHGILHRGVRCNDAKLFSAETHNDVGIPQLSRQSVRYGDEHFVTGLMTEVIADLLEMVDVDHQHGQRDPVAPGTREFFVESLVDKPAMA
jgi:hypothetical protein